MRGHGRIAGSHRRLKWVGRERTSVRGVGTESLQEARTKYLMQEQGTGIGDGRSRPEGGGADRRKKNGGDSRQYGREMKEGGRSGKGGGSL